ncbi:MAG: phosphoribosyl-ATP diphosphatase [Rhodospirillales bacterium]
MTDSSSNVLDKLYAVIESRKGADAASSYTAKLFDAGMAEIARKVGEEAVETITAALSNQDTVTAESADLLYHLLVLWAEAGIKPEEVWAELERREGTSGIEENESRGKN